MEQINSTSNNYTTEVRLPRSILNRKASGEQVFNSGTSPIRTHHCRLVKALTCQLLILQRIAKDSRNLTKKKSRFPTARYQMKQVERHFHSSNKDYNHTVAAPSTLQILAKQTNIL
ncbi:hypothetical protein Tcan_00871, partial [Toxocara canis]